MTPLRVIGLDISSTSTGIALPDGTCRTIAPGVDGDPYRRLHDMTLGVARLIDEHEPDLAIIEGYITGLARNWDAIRLGETGGVIRLLLYQRQIPTVDRIQPRTLKLYACGDGRATKPEMHAAAIDAGARVRNHDEADAWHLWKMAQDYYLENPDLTHYQLPILRRIKWPKFPERLSA